MCAILAQGLRWGNFFSQPPTLMAEPDPTNDMRAFLRTADSKKHVEIPQGRTVTIGRSQKTDLQIPGDRISSTHVEISVAVGRHDGSIIVKDVSLNGTGLLRPDQEPHDAVALPSGTEMIVPTGSGLLVPMRRPGMTKPELQDMETVIWIQAPTPSRPGEGGQRGQELPRRERPPTWPTSWATLPPDVQDVWQDEGIEDVSDLQTFYTSGRELRGHLGKRGIPPAHCDEAEAHWADTSRSVTTSRSSQRPTREEEPRAMPSTTTTVASKKRCRKPKFINGPGLFEQQWHAQEALRTARAAQRQGTQPATSTHLQEVWDIYTRAGSVSTLHREVTEAERDVLKDLILQPIRRYADSLAGRLATWRRWEKWCESHEMRNTESAFRPTDITMGKYLLEIAPNGTTAATQTVASLKWWATHLGIDLALSSPLIQDFRLKKPGHHTKQAEVLPLTAVSRLRAMAESPGTRGTFASILLLIAGGCVRFLHLQRSHLAEVTKDMIVCRCIKGKRRLHGVREGYRWATPRSWTPGSDTLAKAVKLIQDVAEKAEAYDTNPFLVPDLATRGGYDINPEDVWLPRPMSYPRFVAFMRTFITSLGITTKESLTFNALRRLMPTGADVLCFNDEVAAAIGNWQDVPKGAASTKRGRLKDKMAKRYAGDKIITAGHYKLQVIVAIWELHAQHGAECGSWAQLRDQFPDKKVRAQLTKNFKRALADTTDKADPGCMPELPPGPLRFPSEGPTRQVPPLDEIAWMTQSRPSAGQRPWVHFAAVGDKRPYCRRTAFKRDAVREGLGISSAAQTGERPCPRCVNRMGTSAQAVMAEFCMTDGDMNQLQC